MQPCMLRLLLGVSSFLISALPVHSPSVFQNLSRVFPILAVSVEGNRSPCSSQTIDAGFRVECPRHINKLGSPPPQSAIVYHNCQRYNCGL